MKKLTILVDLDSIVVDTMPAWINRINETTGRQAKLEDIKHWQMNANEPFIGLTGEQIFGVLNDPGFTASLPALPGAPENIRRLQDAGHAIYFVTARSGSNTMRETFTWLEKNMPWVDTDTQLVFMDHKWKFKADVAIDDKAEMLARYSQEWPNAHLVSIIYPYNRMEIDGVFEVEYDSFAWESIYDYINALANA